MHLIYVFKGNLPARPGSSCGEQEREVLLGMNDAGYTDPKLEQYLQEEQDDPAEEEGEAGEGAQEEYDPDQAEQDDPDQEEQDDRGQEENDPDQGDQEEVPEEEEEQEDKGQLEDGERPWKRGRWEWSQNWWRGDGGGGGGKKGRGRGRGKGQGNEGKGKKGKGKDKKGKGKGKAAGKHADGEEGEQYGFRPLDRNSASSRGGHYVEGGFVDAGRFLASKGVAQFESMQL